LSRRQMVQQRFRFNCVIEFMVKSQITTQYLPKIGDRD
jgi:hypothetical protein